MTLPVRRAHRKTGHADGVAKIGERFAGAELPTRRSFKIDSRKPSPIPVHSDKSQDGGACKARYLRFARTRWWYVSPRNLPMRVLASSARTCRRANSLRDGIAPTSKNWQPRRTAPPQKLDTRSHHLRLLGGGSLSGSAVTGMEPLIIRPQITRINAMLVNQG